jgi:hypothetical protein
MRVFQLHMRVSQAFEKESSKLEKLVSKPGRPVSGLEIGSSKLGRPPYVAA